MSLLASVSRLALMNAMLPMPKSQRAWFVMQCGKILDAMNAARP